MSDTPGSPPRSRIVRVAQQVLRRIAFYPFLVASLLVFPAWMPWMIAGWLVIAGVRLVRKQPAWPSLALCLALVLIKRVDWTPGMILLMLNLLAAAALDGQSRRRPSWNRAARAAMGALLASWIFLAWEWQRAEHTSRRAVLVPDRPIVCMGDSLSAGGYPRVLEKRLRVPVLDLAQGGLTTADGVKQIPELIRLQPQAVVLELGGHDSLRGRSRAEARKNLEEIIHAARSIGAEVVLFEIPLGFVSDPYSGLDRELARRGDLELLSDGAIRQLVYFSPFTPLGRSTGRILSYDGLHPNEAGNALLAERVEAALVRVYGPGIQR
jgi:lysophospholipase L1-like esterase